MQRVIGDKIWPHLPLPRNTYMITHAFVQAQKL